MAKPNDAPIDRHDIVMRVRRGEMSAEAAEDWAKANDQSPFFPAPDNPRFDPMKEPYWTLAMALAWIIWRTPDSVRENWNAYRQRNAFLKPVDMHDVWREDANVSGSETPGATLAQKELWTELQNGRIEASGVPRFVRGEIGVRGESGRMPIPGHEWIDLSPINFHSGEADSIATATDVEARYDAVRVPRDDVESIWPTQQSSSAASTNCRRWLEKLMRGSPREKPKSKADFLGEAQSKFTGLSKREFDRVWSEAVKESGATWSKSGRPAKKLNHRAD
jgi:hypothetical protein